MTVRKKIFLSVILLFTLTTTFGQVKQDKNFVLSQIKQIFREINDYKNYKIVTIDDSEDFMGHGTDNGGSLKGFFKKDSLKKIVEWVGLSNRVVQNDYYFDKGKLVFAYSTDSRFKYNEATGEFDYSTFDQVFNGRYYFSNDKLIETILSDKEHQKTKEQDAANILTSTKHYIKLLKTRRTELNVELQAHW